MTTNVDKIDSVVVSFNIAEESSYKTLTGSDIWQGYEPNSFSDTGADVKTAPRAPVNTRKRKKGPIVDLDAVGGFNHDFSQSVFQSLLQGFMMANLRPKGEEVVTSVALDTTNPDEYLVASTTGFLVGDLIKGSGFAQSANNAMNKVTVVTTNTAVKVADGSLVAEASPPTGAKIVVVGHEFATGDIDVSVTGDFATYVSTAFDFTTLGLLTGEPIFVGGDAASHADSFSNAGNNGFKRIKSVAAHALVVDRSYGDKTMVAEDNSATSNAKIRMYFGRCLKDEDTAVVRSYSLERVLGAPDTSAATTYQTEYTDGAVPNSLKLNVKTADKVTVDMTFAAADSNDLAAGSQRGGTRVAPVSEDILNTSSDFSFIEMAIISTTAEALTPLFGHVTDMTVTMNNNVSANKAIATLGAFSVTPGEFDVDIDFTGYFIDHTGPQAVRNNSDVTLAFGIVRSNSGLVIDFPVLGLSGGRKTIPKNKPVQMGLKGAAAEGIKYDANFTHTIFWSFFDYLPNAADV